jgi:hypothetical protein
MGKEIVLSDQALVVSGGDKVLIEHFLRYRRKRGEAMLEMFFDRTPRTGDSLWRLFVESDLHFFDFADRVIAGKYVPHQIGWVVGSCMAWPLLLVSIVGKRFLPRVEHSNDMEPESDIIRTRGLTRVYAQVYEKNTKKTMRVFIGSFTSKTLSYAAPNTARAYQHSTHYSLSF